MLVYNEPRTAFTGETPLSVIVSLSARHLINAPVAPTTVCEPLGCPALDWGWVRQRVSAMMLSAACRRVLRSSASTRCSRRKVIHGSLGAAARGRVRALRMLSTSSAEDGTSIAVEPEHIRNIAIIAHVGMYLRRRHSYRLDCLERRGDGVLVWCRCCGALLAVMVVLATYVLLVNI